MSEDSSKSQKASENRRALVTGASGAMGPVMVRHLLDSGYQVRAVSRTRSAPDTIPPSAEYLPGDICDRDFIRRAVQGVDLVFHLAARLHINNPGPEHRADYFRVNVEGTRNLVDASVEEGVQRLVYFSTISVYGPTQGKVFDEETPPRPKGLYGETKLAAEEVVLAAKHRTAGEAGGVVLRMSAIYGPRMKGNYPRLVKALSRGIFLPVGNGRNRRTLIHEQDAVRAALLAAQHPAARGRVYNVSDGAIHELREIIAAICAAIGRRPSRFFLPVRPIRPVARVADGLAGLARRSLNMTAMIEKFVEDIAVSGERIKRELKFKPLYGLRDGWQQAIAAWQEGEKV